MTYSIFIIADPAHIRRVSTDGVEISAGGDRLMNNVYMLECYVTDILNKT